MLKFYLIYRFCKITMKKIIKIPLSIILLMIITLTSYSQSSNMPVVKVNGFYSYTNNKWNIGNVLIPNDWQLWQESNNGLVFAPKEAVKFGYKQFEYGLFIGLIKNVRVDLTSGTDLYLPEILQGNSFLNQSKESKPATLNAQNANLIKLKGRSAITNEVYASKVYTTMFVNRDLSAMGDNDIFYIGLISPQKKSGKYSKVLKKVINSLQFNN